LAQQQNLGLLQGIVFSRTGGERCVQGIHQVCGAAIRYPPQADQQGAGPCVEEGTADAVQIIAPTELAQPGLTGAQRYQRASKPQVKDVGGGERPIGELYEGE
jgi:hypothetical protein